MTDLAPARDLQATRWIVDAVQTFGESVLSLVPGGFESYVRVFHPASRLDEHGRETAAVRWADVARANGTIAGPGMQFRALLRQTSFEYNLEGQPGVFDVGPPEGSPPTVVIGGLVAVLAEHTTCPERCWFAVWEGWGALRADIRSGPLFGLPSRNYHLMVGPLSAACESALDAPAYSQSASLWWPDDRSWIVASEIDLESTYIGCTQVCRNAILDSSTLEAFEVDPGSAIDWYSDPVNPSPQLT